MALEADQTKPGNKHIQLKVSWNDAIGMHTQPTKPTIPLLLNYTTIVKLLRSVPESRPLTKNFKFIPVTRNQPKAHPS
jgi:hypothetical protein